MNAYNTSPSTQHSVWLMSIFYTLAGTLPLTWLALATSQAAFLQSQLLGVFFFSSLLSFIAGSQWSIAIMTQSPWGIQLSILFSILPWIIMAFKQRYGLDIEALWLLLYLECLLLLMMEWTWTKNYIPAWYLATRTAATAIIGIIIAIIINKNLYL